MKRRVFFGLRYVLSLPGMHVAICGAPPGREPCSRVRWARFLMQRT